jgi:DNA helicase-2/ATP-dependent DNA helicase PcrA
VTITVTAQADPTSRLLESLNERQLEAATHGGGTLLILAGAGTGKTTTLCGRAAWLISQGHLPERLLLVTFTRRAAHELVGRARAQAPSTGAGAGTIVGGTFHSLAHRFVRLHAGALGLVGGFGVLDAGDAADLLDLLRCERGYATSTRRVPRASTMLDIYSRVVNAQLPLRDTLASWFPWCEEHAELLSEVFGAYAARKRELGLLDLDDLLLGWRALMGEERTARAIAGGFEHVLVDEYQDVNALQVDIVRELHRWGGGLSVVGDDFQSIYGFRASSPRHILGFADVFPDARTVLLERNYRSTQEILDVANAVSAQDESGFPRRLWSDREGAVRPELVFPHDEGAQAREVCDRVLAAREQAIELRSQAVLFRTGHDSALLELELTRRGIPFVKYGGLRYLDAAHVKDLLALLRLVDNPADELAWFRVLQLLDGVGPARARRILQALRGGHVADGSPGAAPGTTAGGEHWEAASEQVPEGSRAHAASLFTALSRARAAPQPVAGTRVEGLCEALAPLVRLRYPDGAIRVGDLEALAAAARTAPELRSFVAELAIDPPTSSAALAGRPHLDEDYLVLSTVHSAKGLEWEAVHVISAYDGNFPADMSTSSQEGVAEERRLFYVALTRARRRLHVYVPAIFHHRPHGADDAHGLGQASRYLSPEVQRLFTTSRPPGPGSGSGPEPERGTGAAAEAVPSLRERMSVQALFET